MIYGIRQQTVLRLLHRRVYALDEEHLAERDRNLLAVLHHRLKQDRYRHREWGVIRAFSRSLVRDRSLRRQVVVREEVVARRKKG